MTVAESCSECGWSGTPESTCDGADERFWCRMCGAQMGGVHHGIW